MSDREYKQRLQKLLPAGASSLSTRESLDASIERPAINVELKRWGIPFSPLDFQQELISGISKHLQKESLCALLFLPTGTGKTLTTSRILLDTLKDHSEYFSQALWIAPQRELLYQASEAIQSAWWSGRGPDSIDIRMVTKSKGFASSSRPTCWLMTPAMAKKLLYKFKNTLCVTIFDEAHHVAAKIFSEIWNEIRNLNKQGLKLALGLSATPTRENEDEVYILKDAFHRTIITPHLLGVQPLDVLMDRGVLARPIFLKIPGIPGYATRKSTDSKRSHRSFISDEERWSSIVECLSEREPGQIVVFSLDKYHGKTLTRHLRFFRGESAEYVDSDTPLPARIGVFERFRNKTTRILVNVALLIEGVDCPAAESVLLTYPVNSQLRLRQMIGRVLRGPKIGGTKECRVWAAEGSQQWLNKLLFGTDYRFEGWHIIELSK